MCGFLSSFGNRFPASNGTESGHVRKEYASSNRWLVLLVQPRLLLVAHFRIWTSGLPPLPVAKMTFHHHHKSKKLKV